jgi:transposase
MENKSNYIGIDVSKDTLDYCLVCEGQQIFHLQTENNIKGIKTFIKALSKNGIKDLSDVVFCLEHTGIYCHHLISFLSNNNLKIWLESPIQIKKSLGVQRGKNDKIDAIRIAMYAYKNRDEVRLWEPQRKELQKLKHLTGVRKRLLKTIKILNAMFVEKSFYDAEMVKLTKHSTKASVKALKEDLKGIDNVIAGIIKSDDRLSHLFNLVSSVYGIGKVTATQIIISTNEFKSITEAKKFACYCGVVPFEHRSGTSVRGKTRVSNMANMELKQSLHMAALCAIHYKGELQDFFLRKVAEGKNKMSVVNAVRNKLVLRVFACVRDNRLYDRTYEYGAA